MLSENILRKTMVASEIAKITGTKQRSSQTLKDYVLSSLETKGLKDEDRTRIEQLKNLMESNEASDDIEYDPSDEEIDGYVNDLKDEHDIIHAYEDDEIAVIDDETGEEITDDLNEDVLMEIFSRSERLKAKIRFVRTKTKRERKLKIALRKKSSAAKINQRARHLAIRTMKERILRKPVSQMTIGEKERVERIVARRKKVIGRIAMKMVPRIRKIENDRLSHRSFTK